MGIPELSPYGRVTVAAMESRVSRVKALEEIRAAMTRRQMRRVSA